jgi:hypothetical protein
VFGAEPAQFPHDFETVLAREMIICGSPAKVRDQLARQIEQSRANYVMARFAYGDMTDEQIDTSLDFFLAEVMPHFSDRPVDAVAAD